MDCQVTPFVVSDCEYEYCSSLALYIAIHYYRKVLKKRNIFIPTLIPLMIDNQNRYSVSLELLRDIWKQILDSVFAFSGWEIKGWDGNRLIIMNSSLAKYMLYRRGHKQVIEKFFKDQDTQMQNALLIILTPMQKMDKANVLLNETFQICYKVDVLSSWNNIRMNPNLVSALLVLYDHIKEAEDLFGL